MTDGLRLALTTLTVARLRGPARLDRRTAGWAMSLAPLVGLLLGVAPAVVVRLLHDAPLLAAALAVAVLALLTRGLHVDGLADTADGLASYAPPERAREVMKSPEVGALGVATVVLVLVVQVAALAACVEAGLGVEAVLLAAITARVAVTAACTRATPAATPTGMGALVAGSVPRAVPFLLTGLTATAAALLIGPWSAVAVLVALGAAALLRRHAVRRIGGVTGDVLGALVEVTTAVLLVGLAVAA